MNIQIYEFTNWEKPIPDQWIQYVFILGKCIVLRIDFRNQVVIENDILHIVVYLIILASKIMNTGSV